MKKRLFDCDKWKDPWYRKLPPIFKLFWNYLLDNCECWGEWKPDSELTSFLLGTEIDLQEALKNFNTSDKQRVQVFPNGNWFLLDFNYFQYGELSESCNAHKP
ncbi:MAG: hypothetical protein KC733_12610, partial [Candidatus Omnitrophica bacterium]|nr:hypothetical protein [Candidatus Omnitrophota bacterium]